MDSIKNKQQGILLCLVIAIPAWYFGKKYPLLGGPVIAIILGMIISMLLKNKTNFEEGIKFTSKKVLQWAVILLGFGMNLSVVLKTGSQSLPIIISTISTALVLAYFISKIFNIPEKIATLIGVGSSICGGSAIAATAPVIDADDQEVAQAISVIFLFNIIAALIFPSLGKLLGFTTSNGYAFGIFAGTAINDTSSVTAAATTWDNLWNLKSATLDTAVTVKLTRTLAIIPITLGLAFIQSKKNNSTSKFNLKKVFPTFIIYFILASIITTIALNSGISPNIFNPIKQLSKFFIILAMGAIGLNTNLIDLIKNGGKPILLGLICWSGITFVSLLFQYILNIW